MPSFGLFPYINADGTKIAIDGEIVTLDADTVLYDADGNIVAVGNVSIEAALTVNDEISEVVVEDGVVVSITATVIQTVIEAEEDAAEQAMTDATDAVEALETAIAAPNDLTVEADLEAAEALVEPAEDAVALVDDQDLEDRLAAAKTTVEDARVAFDLDAAITAVGAVADKYEMKTVLEANAEVLGLDTATYDTLSATDKLVVAEYVFDQLPLADETEIGTAFDDGVALTQ